MTKNYKHVSYSSGTIFLRSEARSGGGRMGGGVFPSSEADDQAIKGVASGYHDGWNRHAMAALSGLFAEDPRWVDIVGTHWAGKSAVVGAPEALHRTVFLRTEQELIEVAGRAIAPGVAIACAHFRMGAFTPTDGVHRPAAGNRRSLTLTKRSGRWLIAHGQNTVIDQAAMRIVPAAQC